MKLSKIRAPLSAYDLPSNIHQLPTFVLVGRTNVGKSSLFNSFTKAREALVADVPGLTRDYLYGLGRKGSYPYLVIDTGGVNTEASDLEHLMFNQLERAIQEASQILMVVDAKAGLTHQDQLLAKRLRLTQKPISVVVNKSENLPTHRAINEFFSLGFGTPYAVSATQSQGIHELIEAIFKKIPITENPLTLETPLSSQDAPLKLAFVGRPNAGKSTLMNRLLGTSRNLVSDQPGTTRDSVAAPLNYRGKSYILIDTAGIRRRAKVEAGIEQFSVIKSLQAIHASHVVVLLIDASAGITDQDLHLLQFILEVGRALVIAINKWDEVSPRQRKQLHNDLAHRFRFIDFVKICYISALHGTGVGDLFAPIQAAYKSATQVMSTSQLTRLLQAAIQGHALPIVKGRTIKLRYAHPGGYNPPIILIHGKHTKLIPNSYLRYLERFYRRSLGMVGAPLTILFKEKT